MSTVLQARAPKAVEAGRASRVSNQNALSVASRPKVSVAMFVYNHEKFIAQAIESILMQETDFPVEIVIGEDCSTDGTRAIVKNYAERYPHVIRPLFHERNLGMIKNSIVTLESCRGELTAILEGDDYWTDPRKLEKQVGFMDENPEYSMCGTAALNIGVSAQGEETNFGRFPKADTAKQYTLEDILSEYPFLTLTYVFRRDLITLPDWFVNAGVGDMCILALCAEKGLVAYLDEVTAAYRIHSGGTWSGSSMSKRCTAIRETIEILNTHYSGRYFRLLRRREFKLSRWLYLQGPANGPRKEAKSLYWKSFFRYAPYAPLDYLLLGVSIYAGSHSAALDKLTMRLAIRTRLKGLLHG